MPSIILGDNPIRRPEDDALGRVVVARAFAQQVLRLDTTEGVVVGVLGAWGSGKTSFVNLARIEFQQAGVPILDFNPWMFSGTEQLVESFFVELAAQLRVREDLAQLGKDLEEYGESFSGLAWLPFVGPWIERGRGTAKILGKLLQIRREGVGGRRNKLENALTELRAPIVVVLDDIDRLSTSEIRDIFKLVRLTASFPNIIYVVAFDRARVEEALAEQGVPGRDYLEKILQVAIDLPAIPDHVLVRQIFLAVDNALEHIENHGPFDEQVWLDVFLEVIRPLFRNVRDIRRYAAAIHGTIVVLEGQIALVDVLALEAVRIFLPDVFMQMHSAIDGLTKISDSFIGGQGDPPHLSEQIEGLIEAGGMNEKVVRAMINRLFPAGARHIGGSHYGSDWQSRWLRDRRIAHHDILRLYLERIVGEGLKAFLDAEKARAYLDNRNDLDQYLRSLEAERLQDVIASLEAFEDEFAPEHVVPATIVLLNLLPDLPQRQRGMFEYNTRLVVTRVTYRLLRSLSEQGEVEESVRQILPELNSLSSKMELITEVGYRDGEGHELVSEAFAVELETAWREEVQSATDDDLATDKSLLSVLLKVKRELDPEEGELEIGNLPQLTLTLLRSARGDVLSQAMDSRAVRRSPRLAWEALIELFGDE